jgi:hypothetical protein
METPVQKEKMKPKKGKVTNLFEDMEYHQHNKKSYDKQIQKQSFNNNKRGKSSQKV